MVRDLNWWFDFHSRQEESHFKFTRLRWCRISRLNLLHHRLKGLLPLYPGGFLSYKHCFSWISEDNPRVHRSTIRSPFLQIPNFFRFILLHRFIFLKSPPIESPFCFVLQVWQLLKDHMMFLYLSRILLWYSIQKFLAVILQIQGRRRSSWWWFLRQPFDRS